ncbi:MAG: acetylglutamate kinase [Candidatus Promineifilaceae bacterium]
MRVIKIGGNELGDPYFLKGLAQAVAVMAEPAIIVHGGGRDIAALQQRLGLETIKIDGLRVTDAESLAVAQMVLSGHANKQIVKALLAAGVQAVGLSGVDGRLLTCAKKEHPTADLGFVGTVTAVNTPLLLSLIQQNLTLVISPISIGLDGATYNVNADEAASAIAGALSADILDFVSNVPGVLHNGRVLPQLTVHQTETLIADGIIRDGMVPKVRAALEAIQLGVHQARIVNLAGLEKQAGTVFRHI